MAPPPKSKTKPQPPATIQNFPIVGIGASAGGLDAFKRLLSAIPEDSGMAYVLVQHLDPSHESILPEILQRVTKIPVHEISEDIHLAPDHIYVIPSNKMLVSTDGVLKLNDRARKINFSIDVFFTSLADVHKEFAVGVVLSGTGTDGTLGLKAIKEHGGISFAQDSESAAFDSMPESAVNAGVVDFILAPEKIPEQLLLINKTYKKSHFYKGEEEIPKDDEFVFKQILLVLRQRSGVDFTYYKKPTFHRRIARRIAIVKRKGLSDYLIFLRSDIAEQSALFQDVLVPVTSFFRDPKSFQILTENVFPELFKNKDADEPIRIWIAGCSTGEEAFSIAICLQEFFGKKISNKKIQIFASDISEKAIRKARAGTYSKADVEGLSDMQLKNYFKKNNGDFEVNKVLRDMCVFAPHNFLKDPPFAKMDLVSCRNVLIYMDTFLQKKAFTTFHFALRENGFLLLGKSEATGASSDLFTQFSKNEKIYSRKALPGRFMHVATARREETLTIEDRSATKYEAVHTDFRKSAEAIMISKSPACVVVNEAMDIVHIYGEITPFLQAPQGKPSHNVFKMAGQELVYELRSAIHNAIKKQVTITKENIPLKTNGKQSLVRIEIIPLTDTVEPHYLIRFEKKDLDTYFSPKEKGAGKRDTISLEMARVSDIEEELLHTREDIRSITEDMEASNEELQSANEELQSSNEEMQSLNEELETSKEELESTNEELIIVNQEMLEKQEQLNISRFYSEAIVTTVREPLVVLDKALRVKTANASFYKDFNVEEKETEGKLFYEIQDRQFDDTLLRTLLENILPQKNRIEDYEINLSLPGKGQRIILINARQIVNEKKAEQLILLAMEDITERVRSKKILIENDAHSRKERQLLQDFFTQSPALLAILKGPEYVFEFANPNFIDLSGGRNLIGKSFRELIPDFMDASFLKLLDNVYSTGEIFIGKEMLFLKSKEYKKNDQIYLNLTLQAFSNEQDEREGILVFAYAVTELILARKQIEKSEEIQNKLATQLKLATDSAKVGIWSLDIVSSKVEWSIIHRELWGYEDYSADLTYSDWYKAIVPEDRALAFQRIEESRVNHSIYEVEYRINRANDGAMVWIKSTGHYQYDKLGVAQSLTGISLDITRQKKITEDLESKVNERTYELKSLVEELNQSNSQLEQFAYVASHDLQEPLRKIITFSMRLQDNLKHELSDEVKLYLNKIENASNRMASLVRDLLNYSRLLQHEKLFVRTDLNEVLRNILIDFELLIEEKKALIEFDNLPTVDAVPLQMNQLFYNLIGNALKFSKVDVPPIISITSSTLSKEQIQMYPALDPLTPYVEIVVKDNGIGFDQKYAKRIFAIFQRLHDKVSYIGTGIGLALSQKIIENHHGEIFANANENKGASFHLILPFSQLS